MLIFYVTRMDRCWRTGHHCLDNHRGRDHFVCHGSHEGRKVQEPTGEKMVDEPRTPWGEQHGMEEAGTEPEEMKSRKNGLEQEHTESMIK